jgi:hypothetical protein
MRQYISLHSSRHIGVGYSAADVREVLQDTYTYLACSIDGTSNDNTTAEHFGLNAYSWCGADATYISAGYDTLVSMFSNADIPVFFSEYGCNQPPGIPRVFNEVQALYGTNMTGLNGGLVYEYSEEADDYGLVTINSDGSVTLRTDYDNLQAQYNKIDLTLQTKVPSSTGKLQKCDPSLITSSGFGANWTLPVQPPGAADLIQAGVSNPVVGKLVDIGSTSVTQKVIGTDGNAITGLTLQILTTANTPSHANTSGGVVGSATNGTASGSPKKKGDASSSTTISTALVLIAGIAAGMFALA